MSRVKPVQQWKEWLSVPDVAQQPNHTPQSSMTNSAPLNFGLAATAAGLTNTGVAIIGEDKWANVIAIALNLLMQPLKRLFPILAHTEVAIVVMILVGLGIGYFVLFQGDPNVVARSFQNGVLGTFQAIANYKADKASGLGIMKSAVDEG